MAITTNNSIGSALDTATSYVKEGQDYVKDRAKQIFGQDVLNATSGAMTGLRHFGPVGAILGGTIGYNEDEVTRSIGAKAANSLSMALDYAGIGGTVLGPIGYLGGGILGALLGANDPQNDYDQAYLDVTSQDWQGKSGPKVTQGMWTTSGYSPIRDGILAQVKNQPIDEALEYYFKNIDSDNRLGSRYNAVVDAVHGEAPWSNIGYNDFNDQSDSGSSSNGGYSKSSMSGHTGSSSGNWH